MAKPTKSYLFICKKGLDACRELLHDSGVRLAADKEDKELQRLHEKAAIAYAEVYWRYQEALTAFHA